jgi:hypothetical protein
MKIAGFIFYQLFLSRCRTTIGGCINQSYQENIRVFVLVEA